MLAYANFSLPFILEVDACQNGLGAMLSQEQEGKVRPLTYTSRTLNRTEKRMPNYSSMKLEFLALKWAMAEKFREYLLGCKVIVWTDNNPWSNRVMVGSRVGSICLYHSGIDLDGPIEMLIPYQDNMSLREYPLWITFFQELQFQHDWSRLLARHQ